MAKAAPGRGANTPLYPIVLSRMTIDTVWQKWVRWAILHWIPRFATENVNKVDILRNLINSNCILLLSMYTLIILTMRLCTQRNSCPKWRACVWGMCVHARAHAGVLVCLCVRACVCVRALSRNGEEYFIKFLGPHPDPDSDHLRERASHGYNTYCVKQSRHSERTSEPLV